MLKHNKQLYQLIQIKLIMASKIPKKIFDVQKKLVTYQIRITKFFRHKLLAQRKSVLLVGGTTNPEFKTKLQHKLLKTCTLTGITFNYPPDSQLYKIVTDFSKAEYHKIQVPYSSNLRLQNYKDIESQLKGKHFDAIVVLPDKQSQNQSFDIDNEQFLSDYDPLQGMFNNLLAYRVANKFLSTSGVLIFSTSEHDFIKEQTEKKIKQLEKQKDQTKIQLLSQIKNAYPKRLPASKYLLDCQKQYLGVLVGDRDYTDLNSWSVIGLSEQAIQDDADFVSQMYRNWAQGVKLPMPGSFALFKRKAEIQKKCSHVQFL